MINKLVGVFVRNFAEINLYNIKENFRATSGGNPAVAVVKADAYGHGAIDVARALKNDALAFAVSNIDEAEELCSIGLRRKVVILGDGYAPEFDRAIDCGAIVSVGNIENARLLDAAANRKQTFVLAVLCVDTGMNRDGFRYDDFTGIAEAMSLKNVAVVGIYSHPSQTDDEEFTIYQREKFSSLKALLPRSEGLIFSFGNSANICSDYVPRIGVSLYGLSPTGENDSSLLPAMTFKAAVLSTRRVVKGEYIGYGKTYQAPRDMAVATVAAGYADGVPRALSNVGSVIIGGKKCRIVGSVCMDATMIDVFGVDVDIGDYAVFIGTDGKERITCEEVARLSDTINYEIVCGISKRVPRIYKEK